MGIYDVFDDDEPAAAPPAPAAAAASSIYSAAVPSVDLPPRRGPSLREQAGLDPSPRELLPRSLAPAPAQASAPPRTFFELPAISKPPVEEEEEVVVPGGALDLISNMFGPKPAVGKGAGGKASSGARKVSAVTAAASKQPRAASRGSSAHRILRTFVRELPSSESSEGSIGPGNENVVVLPRLLVKPFDTDLRTVSSPISSGSCSASLSSSLSHIEFLSADGSVSL